MYHGFIYTENDIKKKGKRSEETRLQVFFLSCDVSHDENCDEIEERVSLGHRRGHNVS